MAIALVFCFFVFSSPAETEPNGTRTQANALTLNSSLQANATGKINPRSDLDYYSVITPSFSGKTTLRVTMTPTSPDGELGAVLQLFDSNGVFITSTNSGFDGEPEVLTFSQANPSTTYFIVCLCDDSIVSGAGDYTLQISFPVLDADPNDQISGAVALGAMSQTRSTTGEIDSPTDVDMFSITVQAGQRISFDIDQTSVGFDSLIRLFDGNGTELAKNDDAKGPGETLSLNSYLEYTFNSAGTYYLGVSGKGNATYNAVSGAGDTSGSTGSYTLVVSPGLAGVIVRPGDSTLYGVDILRYGTNPAAINPEQRTWIIVHGWRSSRTNDNIAELTESFAQSRPQDQILTLDWREAANTSLISPDLAEDSILPVAEWAATVLASYGFHGTNLNLVGHSFGSYVSDEIAQRISGGVNTIITLDPAIDILLGDYDPISDNQVNFARDSFFSWSFHSSSAGNDYLPTTADEAFIVDSDLFTDAAHGAVVNLFAYMLLHPDDSVAQYFLLNYLMSASFGPWEPNHYSSFFSADSDVQGYEAVITANSDGKSPQSISFVDIAAPVLSITNLISGQVVSANTVIVGGTATDVSRGSQGISSVTVNGIRASGDTASGSAVANWNRAVTLNVGVNILTVVARDNYTSHNATTNTLSITYTPTVAFQPPAAQSAASIHSQGFALNLQLEVGRAFRVQSSPDLIVWTDRTNFTSTGAAFQFIDTQATNANRLFYRALSP